RAMGYLATYDAICPISEFSAHWLERYWGPQLSRERVSILYPPVDVHLFSPREARRRVILGIGRFVKGGGHEKKQHLMIRAFKRLLRDGLTGWELHLVGGSMSEARHRAYLDECRRLAAGAPVVFHVDAPAAELTELVETASIYWHATGYGTRDPILHEHFGISVVEAMSGGCVPIVVKQGAAAELVDDGESGYLWQTMAEWRRRTLEVANDDALRRRLAARAVERSKRYGRDVFRRHLLEIVAGLSEPRGQTSSAASASAPAPVSAAPSLSDAGS
ncbi:MAG TPA: glycosyltransferase family 4 protein, partial [Chloroflexota bacterium]|nr:glycosyltransferase family 4 protein [Chloroflexota bacterium]